MTLNGFVAGDACQCLFGLWEVTLTGLDASLPDETSVDVAEA